MARELSLYAVLQDKIRSDFTAIDDPSNHTFSRFFVDACAVLAAYGDGFQATAATLCARGINSWATDEQSSYLSEIDLPGRVFQQMASPDEWPSFVPQETPQPPQT